MKTRHTFPPDSAGRLMTENVPVVRESWSIRETEQYLSKHAKELETIDYLYVVDDDRVLGGVLSIKELLSAERPALVGEVMTRTVVAARAHTDQERVAFMALRHSIKAVPVVDSSRHFLGIVTADQILRVLDQEATENLAKISGVKHVRGFASLMDISIIQSVKHRLPWLVLGLGGGFLTAGIIGNFEEMLEMHIMLVAFIPLIVYLAGVIGTQVSTMIVRDLAVDPSFRLMPYLRKQFLIVMSLSGVLGAILFLVTSILYGAPMVGLVMALALVAAAGASLVTSLIFPFFLNMMRIDPVNAGGPISIILQDMLSVSIYLSVAMLLLS